MSSIKKGVSGGGGATGAGGGAGPNALNVNSVGAHGKISPSNPDYAAQNSFRKMPDE